MNKTDNPLTKICSVCGSLKPLSAFLQLSDKNEAIYGNICSDCRHANKGKNIEKEGDETSQTKLTLTIDAKVRAQYEVDQKEHHDQTEEDYYKEREKDELQETKRLEKNERVKDEKKIRSSLFDRNSVTSPAKTTTQTINQQQVNQRLQQTEEIAKQETAAKEEQKEKDIDLTAPVEDTRFGKKEKHKGVAFQHFSYAQSTVIGKAFSNTSSQTAPSETKKNTPSEYIEKTWGPGSKRR